MQDETHDWKIVHAQVYTDTEPVHENYELRWHEVFYEDESVS